MLARVISVSTFALVIAAPAFAAGQDATTTSTNVVAPAPTAVAPTPKLVFTLRGGVAGQPEYFGSDDYKVGPDLGFKFNYLALRNGRTFGNPDPWADTMGLSFGGSFRVVGERDTSDFSELAGLDDIDTAVEIGGSVSYGMEYFVAFAEVRRGFGGHEGWVGELGADAILRPTDRLRLSAGPRLFFGDNTYSDTYFGVTPAEASANLSAYNPDGGLISAGVELGARYQINDVWGLEGAVTWETFSGDAQDSPIVQQGDDEQWGIRFGLTRVFSIGG